MNANRKPLGRVLCLTGLLAAIGLSTACETPKTKGEAVSMGVSQGLGALADSAVPFVGSAIAQPLTDKIAKDVGDRVDKADGKPEDPARKQDHEQYNRLREKSPDKYRKLQGDKP